MSVPPTTPPTLSLTPGDGEIRAVWGASGNEPDGYYVYWTTDEVTWWFDDSYMPNRRTATIVGLTNGVNHWVKVVAFNEFGESAPIIEGPVVPQPAPPAPAGVRARAGSGSLLVSWDAVESATYYRVRIQDTGGVWSSLFTVSAPDTSLMFSDVVNGAEVATVEVRAYNATGASPAVTTGPALPTVFAPATVSAVSGVGVDYGVELTLSLPSDVLGFEVLATVTAPSAPLTVSSGLSWSASTEVPGSSGVGATVSPVVPVSVVAQADGSLMEVNWRLMPETTDYQVVVSEAGVPVGSTDWSPEPWAFVAGVAVGSAVSVEVTGRNDAGVSVSASESLTVLSEASDFSDRVVLFEVPLPTDFFYTVGGLTPDVPYYFTVRLFNEYGWSADVVAGPYTPTGVSVSGQLWPRGNW